jgi:hypothetical protein
MLNNVSFKQTERPVRSTPDIKHLENSLGIFGELEKDATSLHVVTWTVALDLISLYWQRKISLIVSSNGNLSSINVILPERSPPEAAEKESIDTYTYASLKIRSGYPMRELY